MIPVLWICGPPGVGKTTVAWHIYTRLHGSGARPAYVDVDQLGICYPPPADDPARHTLKARNVRRLRTVFAAAGARCLIVSGVVDADHGVGTEMIGGASTTVVRLRISRAELSRRLRRRGESSAQVDLALEEAERLDETSFADTTVDTTGLSTSGAAHEILARYADWPVSVDSSRRRPGAAREDVQRPGGEVLWLYGPTGVGKSTIGFRVYLQVLQAGVPAAFVDVDQLGFHGNTTPDHEIRARCLSALWTNFQAAGAEVLAVVGPIGTQRDALTYERVLADARVTWCRLHASDRELTRRILSRQSGGSWFQPGDPLRDQPTERLHEIARRAIADAQALAEHEFAIPVDVDGLPVDQAVAEILTRAAWPSSAGRGPAAAGGGCRCR